MLGSFPLNQLEQTPEICLMSSLHFVQSLRIMALTVFNAICLAKWPWCEVDDDDNEACCDEGDDAMIASGFEAFRIFFFLLFFFFLGGRDIHYTKQR